MDGYAVRAAELAVPPPRHPVGCRSSTTSPRATPAVTCWRPAEALRIMTGAPMPEGADAIVRRRAHRRRCHRGGPVPGARARSVGACAEARTSTSATWCCASGTRLGARAPRAGSPPPTSPSWSCTDGRGSPWCRPATSSSTRVAPPARPDRRLQPRHAPRAVEAAGAELAAGVHLRDDADAVRALVADRQERADLVITSGGVSMGVYDTVKEVLSSGWGVDFVKVAMRPGHAAGLRRCSGAQRGAGLHPSRQPGELVRVVPRLRRSRRCRRLAGLDPDVDGGFDRRGRAWAGVRRPARSS